MPRLLPAFLALVLVAGLLTGSPPAAAEPIVFQTDMYGSAQTPPVETKAYGFVRFFFNDDRSAADYTVDVKGLATGLVLGADIHRDELGESGPVVKKLAEGGFIVAAGRLRLSDDDLEELAEGMWYVSLKTVEHPDGELRGQIVLPAGFMPAQASPTPRTPITPPQSFDPDDTLTHPPVVDTLVPARTEDVAQGDDRPPSGGLGVRPPNTGEAGLR